MGYSVSVCCVHWCFMWPCWTAAHSLQCVRLCCRMMWVGWGAWPISGPPFWKPDSCAPSPDRMAWTHTSMSSVSNCGGEDKKVLPSEFTKEAGFQGQDYTVLPLFWFHFRGHFSAPDQRRHKPCCLRSLHHLQVCSVDIPPSYNLSVSSLT